jgi:hypothetical protein
MISLDGIHLVEHNEAFMLMARDHPRPGKYIAELERGTFITIDTTGGVTETKSLSSIDEAVAWLMLE